MVAHRRVRRRPERVAAGGDDDRGGVAVHVLPVLGRHQRALPPAVVRRPLGAVLRAGGGGHRHPGAALARRGRPRGLQRRDAQDGGIGLAVADQVDRVAGDLDVAGRRAQPGDLTAEVGARALAAGSRLAGGVEDRGPHAPARPGHGTEVGQGRRGDLLRARAVVVRVGDRQGQVQAGRYDDRAPHAAAAAGHRARSHPRRDTGEVDPIAAVERVDRVEAGALHEVAGRGGHLDGAPAAVDRAGTVRAGRADRVRLPDGPDRAGVERREVGAGDRHGRGTHLRHVRGHGREGRPVAVVVGRVPGAAGEHEAERQDGRDPAR
ncbi:hypothetical protein G5V59_18530 [Nocardioides sp. W3-2-3]|uniref:hypothetical protein n=1 Tax=Nocardioides convexus TaxID=2712224 RepID=UPI002418474B|nr:hypothetical protein [Nocardioides convexus]NHA01174.1 hypothetical protein [Nocardioides convexus]